VWRAFCAVRVLPFRAADSINIAHQPELSGRVIDAVHAVAGGIDEADVWRSAWRGMRKTICRKCLPS
jgi:hypothetical protein